MRKTIHYFNHIKYYFISDSWYNASYYVRWRRINRFVGDDYWHNGDWIAHGPRPTLHMTCSIARRLLTDGAYELERHRFHFRYTDCTAVMWQYSSCVRSATSNRHINNTRQYLIGSRRVLTRCLSATKDRLNRLIEAIRFAAFDATMWRLVAYATTIWTLLYVDVGKCARQKNVYWS